MQIFVLLLKVINFLLKQLDIEAPQLQRRSILYVIGVNVEQICLHLHKNVKTFYSIIKMEDN